MNYDDYVKFCKEQDPNKEIDHTGWSTCSIGEYLESIDEEVDLWDIAEMFGVDEVSADLWDPENLSRKSLYNALNQRGLPVDDPNVCLISTYGELVELMEKTDDGTS